MSIFLEKLIKASIAVQSHRGFLFVTNLVTLTLIYNNTNLVSIDTLVFDMTEKMRVQNQDDWKRTQIRIPVVLYDNLVEYAQNNNLSINTAMLELIDKGLQSNTSSKNLNQEQLKAILKEIITPQHKELLNKIDDLQNLQSNKKAP